ncbi:hypothetical protein [Nocardiopsis sp. NPDC055824]
MSEPMSLHAPRSEGDGYYAGRALQWVDSCPHMGHSEKTLLRVLTNLTLEYTQVRKLAPAALQKMIYVGAVDLGKAPKTISSSGLLRLLRALAALGQITDPDGGQLTFSSGEKAQLHGISMSIWRYPRHECGYARNSHDALAIITEGDSPRFGPTGLDIAATWPESTPDQAGQKSDQAGQKSDQAGQKSDQAGQKSNLDTQRDLQEDGPPLSSSLSSPSSSSSSPPPQSAQGKREEEEEMPSAPTSGAASVTLIQSLTDATEDEAAALVEIIRPKVKHTLSGLIRSMAKNDDLGQQLWSLRRQRAPQARPGVPVGRGGGCSLHSQPSLPCRLCAQELRDEGEAARRDLMDLLEKEGPEARPDLVDLLGLEAAR